MTIIVETGQGIADANVLCAVAHANNYHALRGNDKWADLDTLEKEAALVKATDYLTQMYRGRWKGVRSTHTQALDWPRAGVEQPDVAHCFILDAYSIPNQIKDACAILALISTTEDLLPNLTRGVLSETVGSVSITYDPRTPEGTRRRNVDMLLRPFLGGGFNSMKLVRG